jgi:polyhydroxybutyrate depolymerase
MGRTKVIAATVALVWLLAPAVHADVPSTCQVDPSTQSVRVESQGAAYDVLVHVPADATADMPLAFNLHGSTQSGSAHRDDGSFDRSADEYGYIVAYPDGGVPGIVPRPPAPVWLPAGYYWNIPGVPLVGDIPVPPGSRDDVQFIADAIDTMVAQLCVDPERVYVTGASGGGRMASLLGCALADKITAIAPVIGVRAGNPDPDDATRPDGSCQPTRPMPVAALHGLRDTQNPYEGGGSQYWGYSVPTAMETWAALDGCAHRAPDVPLTPTVTEQRYRGCKQNADVVLYVSSIMGHTWPGSSSTTSTVLAPAIGETDANFPGNDLILSFFDAHPRRH